MSRWAILTLGCPAHDGHECRNVSPTNGSMRHWHLRAGPVRPELGLDAM
jgi:hypothetical protein